MQEKDDLISRQAAIDVLHEYFGGMLDTDTVCPADIYGLFECIPSAQPEIVRCKNCKWYGKVDKMFYRKNTCTNPRVQMKPSPMDYCSEGRRRKE